MSFVYFNGKMTKSYEKKLFTLLIQSPEDHQLTELIKQTRSRKRLERH